MDTNTVPHNRVVHHGRNIKRLREMLGVKQETIASELDVTQPYISELEQKDVIEDRLLVKIANILKVPVDAIKNMNDEVTYNYISTFNDKVEHVSGVNGPFISCSFNPFDKIVDLYERLLKTEQEKNEAFEKRFSALEQKFGTKK